MNSHMESSNSQPEIIQDITDGWVKEWDSSEKRYWWVPNEYIEEKKNRPDLRINDNWKDRPKRTELNEIMLEAVRNQEEEIKSVINSIRSPTTYLLRKQRRSSNITINLESTERRSGNISNSPYAREINHCEEIIEKLKGRKLEKVFSSITDEMNGEFLDLHFLSEEETRQALLRTLLYLANKDSPDYFIEKNLDCYWKFKIRCPRCGDIFQVKFEQFYKKSQDKFKLLWPHNQPETEYYCSDCKQERLEIVNEEKDLDKPVEHMKWRDDDDPNYKVVKAKYRDIFREKIGISRTSSAREKELYHTICKVLEGVENSEILRNNRDVLEGLELDIYIPDKELAFEYQGKQHEEPVNFGGEEDPEEILRKQKERDKKTRQKCKERDITLIEIWSDEEITEDSIRKKIKKAS